MHFEIIYSLLLCYAKLWLPLGENMWLETNQSVLCCIPTLFNQSAEVWNKQLNWSVYAKFWCPNAIEISKRVMPCVLSGITLRSTNLPDEDLYKNIQVVDKVNMMNKKKFLLDSFVLRRTQSSDRLIFGILMSILTGQHHRVAVFNNEHNIVLSFVRNVSNNIT